MTTHRHVLRSLFALCALGAVASPALAAAPPARLDQPIAEVWPAAHEWNDAEEQRYSDFIATVGRGVAAGRCHHLSDCLNDPVVNPLFEAGDPALHFHADCADAPYVLRAYFAFRRDLPFAHAEHMEGRGRDERYFKAAHPVGLVTWRESTTPRRLLEKLPAQVHTGFFRTAPSVENADFYQVAIERGAIRPGTMYYDPNGHVLIVYAIAPSGDLLMFDAHPDNSVTHGAFSESIVLGSAGLGGGFKNFRPITRKGDAILQASNSVIPDFGGEAPFDRARYVVKGLPVCYHAWVRSCLASEGAKTATR